jgi:type VI secretion system protein ImpF
MARSAPKAPPRLSLFDRLLQGDSIETDRNADRAMRELRDSVRRDLEILFNTRPRFLSFDPKLDELRTSLISFGLHDLQTQQMATPSQQEQFRIRLEALIRRFEPRLREVSVEVSSATETLDRTLRFRVHAVLLADATSEAVVYDTLVDPVSGGLIIMGGAKTTA